jgi:cobalt-zinc-cadmium efflux system protein
LTAGHHGREHEHGHGGHAHGPSSTEVADLRGSQRRALLVALALNAGVLVVQVAGGLLFGSLALLADSAHLASDVAGLLIALGAAHLAARPASGRHTYGFQRAEVLGAQLNAASLLLVTAWVVIEAVQRLRDPVDLDAGPVLAIALLGLAANVVSAVLLSRVAGRSLNMRGAVLHMTADALGSVGVVVAALVAGLSDTTTADPIASLVISALVLWSSWGLLRSVTRVLLEAAPSSVDLSAVTRLLESDPAVDAVHHLHVWSLASDAVALSGHVVLRDIDDLHGAQVVGDRLRHRLDHDLQISHATLELECHPCEEPDVPH